MAFSLGTLSTYTDGRADLVAKLVAKGQTTELVNIYPDVKSAVSIPTHSTTLYIQAGACGWAPSGTTTIGNLLLSVSLLMYAEELCVQTAEQYQLQWQIKSGSDGNDVDFAERFVDEKLAQLALV